MPPLSDYSFMDEALEKRKKENKFRTLQPLYPKKVGATVERDGHELVNFSSNDYLGLSSHARVIRASVRMTEEYGAGSTASRLVCGTYDLHTDLEGKLADQFDSEAALVFNSGFQANSSIISTITDRKSLILTDKLGHNSLLQGAMLSRAKLKRFRHNDLDHLERLLQRADKESLNRLVIATETVFSMDGDRANVDRLIEISRRFETMLYIDEAHAVGVWGDQGLGFTYQKPDIDLRLGTFGKAFGSFGAFLLCSQKMKDYLVNFCPGFIYTTALPPSVIGAVNEAASLISGMNEERNDLHENASYIRERLKGMGYSTHPSTTQIIPVLIGDEQATLELSGWLDKHGILATAIRPPTVPEEKSRIRLTLSSEHNKEQIDYLLETIEAWDHE